MTLASVWRSMIFVPTHIERFVQSAQRCGADAVILDLEDSVPPAEKAKARKSLPAAARAVSAHADVIVRVNRPWRLCVQDIEAAVLPEVSAILIPKVHSAAHVQFIAEVVDEIEAERGIEKGGIKLFPVIETIEPYFDTRAIARASSRISALMLGPEDFALSTGMRPLPEGLLLPSQEIVFAARAAGVIPYGCIATVADYNDLDFVRDVMRRSYLLGFEGATCIHPSVIPILNEEFSPSPKEFEHAKEVISVFEQGLADGKGAVALRGQMIDLPIVERARNVVRSYLRHNAH